MCTFIIYKCNYRLTTFCSMPESILFVFRKRLNMLIQFCFFLVLSFFCVWVIYFIRSDGFIYIRNLLFLFILDGLLLDDEPIWEPLEWSLLQTWLLFIFIFAWIAEVLFSSKYGSYTNRDKKVWIGLHKTYWFFQLWFIMNIFIVMIFVTLPFYFEITYSISYLVVWWNWFNSFFFFKLTFVFSFVLILTRVTNFYIRWCDPKLSAIFVFLISCLLGYLLFFNFLITFFSFFSDVDIFTKTGWVEFDALSQGPLKWGYGSAERDHFSYHKTTLSFWFKNDPQIAGSMLFLNLFIFFYLFFLFIFSLSILRAMVSNTEFTFNNLSFFFSSVKQFYYLIIFLIFLLFMSVLYSLIRFPFELFWFTKLLYFLYSMAVVILDFICIF